MDFFAGSGTTGEAAANNRRDFLLIDSNAQATQIMAKRLERFAPELVNFSCDLTSDDSDQTDLFGSIDGQLHPS